MNKFTFIVEKDENKLTPEEELENSWNNHFQNKPIEEILADSNLMSEIFMFYHKMMNAVTPSFFIGCVYELAELADDYIENHRKVYDVNILKDHED
jgi:hypothetical protein